MATTTHKVQSILTELRGAIAQGKYQPGDLLPTIAELCERYDCSVGVVSKATAMLAHEGLVEQRRGVGTRVLKGVVEDASVDLNAFALIYPSEKHEGIRRIVHGFHDQGQERSRQILTLTTGIDYKKEGELIGRLKEFDVKGAVIYSIVQNLSDQIYISQVLSRTPFPIVLAGVNLPGVNLPVAMLDVFHASYTMTKYLIGQGSKNIGLLASRRSPDMFHGYVWAMLESGREMDPRWVHLIDEMHPNFQEPVRESEAVAEGYLKARPDVDAVVCDQDFTAIGLIDAALAMGIDVPTELKVVGVDDFDVAANALVPLTTYRAPYDEIGRTAFELLHEHVTSGCVAIPERKLRGEIIIRKSA